MKNPVPQIMYSCQTTFISREKIVAQRIIDENAHKPRKKMGPMDYSMKDIPVQNKRWDRSLETVDYRARRVLAASCIKLLREDGAQTTKTLAKATKRNTASVSAALRNVPGIESERINGSRSERTGHYSTETLWMMPVSVAS
jgi:hypothetical protein